MCQVSAGSLDHTREMRCVIRGMCLASCSHPTVRNLDPSAASMVVPLPANGSSTTPPDGVSSFTNHVIRVNGLTLTWDTFLPSSPMYEGRSR